MDENSLKDISFKIASSLGRTKTAGKIEFIRDQGPVRRDVRAPGFVWDKDSYKVLLKVLWATQKAQNFALSAQNEFSSLPSSSFSPDGLLGGRGYIQNIKDMRKGLSQSIEVLSSFTDTIKDEVEAGHWKKVIKSVPETSEIIESVEDMGSDPQSHVENEYDEEISSFDNVSDDDSYGDESDDESSDYESEPVGNPNADDLNPQMEEDEESDEYDDYDGQFQTAASKNKKLSSSLPVDTLSGPRVNHIGPGEGSDSGTFNYDEPWPSDDPTGEGLSSGTNETVPIYESEYQDGVSPWSGNTDGDSSVFKVSGDSYSWLPGASNDKPMNYYQRGLSEPELAAMKEEAKPEMPRGILPDNNKKGKLNLWDDYGF